MNRLFFACVACLLHRTTAWGFFGHTLTLNIARLTLNLTNEQFENLQTMINQELPYFPSYTFESGAMASWADALRSSTSLFADWHFIDWPYIPATNPANFTPQIPVTPQNITWALDDLLGNTLHSKSASSWTKGFALRFVFHLIGDLHQPVSLRSPSPTGNSFYQTVALCLSLYATVSHRRSRWQRLCRAFQCNEPNHFQPALVFRLGRRPISVESSASTVRCGSRSDRR